jgi:hypothetical protein
MPEKEDNLNIEDRQRLKMMPYLCKHHQLRQGPCKEHLNFEEKSVKSNSILDKDPHLANDRQPAV